MARFNLEDYEQVEDRLKRFWAENTDGRISTALLSNPDNDKQCVVRAEVYRNQTDVHPTATGIAQEHAGGSGANSTSWVENAETSAIGRALANWTFSGNKRPSREEMQKANRGPQRPMQQAPRPQQPAPEPRQPTPFGAAARQNANLPPAQAPLATNGSTRGVPPKCVCGKHQFTWLQTDAGADCPKCGQKAVAA